MLNIDFLLANGATYKKVPKGNFVFHEGMSCSYYYQLVDGRIRWGNSTDTGKECIQSIIEPGECFGELPLFDDAPYAAGALAEVDCIVLRLPKSTFIQLMKDNPDLLFAFTRLMAQRLRFKFIILKELTCYSPEHQILTLMEHFKLHDDDSGHNGHHRINLTRQQIADMTGLRVETVIRTIKKLQHTGQLSIDKGKVYC